MSNTVELLQAARKLIADVGWCQNDEMIDVNGSDLAPRQHELAVAYCMTGACSQACWFDLRDRSLLVSAVSIWSDEFYGMCDALHAALIALKVRGVPEDSRDIPEWNDADDRTVAEVLAVFDKAIEIQQEIEDGRVPDLG